ncbi:2-keto-3-deoxy-l-rhamnonate aldolase [Phtheirospermum japonicum]|uniref:2-keto-3-deoxy-l-rhamnonate aldolase n=1 Tax=Phtheirospermum japonicum TaxID=374723 RepID=A0A830BZR0_9LAMI|nr:2-keto-3-deoxy-l-rhamnonate aldolase [Phtheirospermum japonicum]
MASFSQPLSLSSASLSTLRKSLYASNANSKTSSFSFLSPLPPIPNPSSKSQAPNVFPAPLDRRRRHQHGRHPPSRLKNGETLYGIFLLTFSPTIAEIAGHAGYDFAVVDMEHGHGGISSALPCLHALAATNTAAILRLPESSAAWAKKALDLGPQGIMFPMIDNPKLARKAVSYCRFPPNGVRGSAHTIIRASDYGIDEGYLSNYEEELLIMCQVESEEGVKKIDEISSVDGVDCVQMGPTDLSASMGYLWDPGHKKVKEALRGAEKAVLKGGEAYLSGFAMPHDGAAELRRRGYHMVAGAVDIGLFRNAAVEDVRKFKVRLEEEQESDEEKENGKVPAEEKYWSE